MREQPKVDKDKCSPRSNAQGSPRAFGDQYKRRAVQHSSTPVLHYFPSRVVIHDGSGGQTAGNHMLLLPGSIGGNVAMLTPGGHAAIMTTEGVWVRAASRSR